MRRLAAYDEVARVPRARRTGAAVLHLSWRCQLAGQLRAECAARRTALCIALAEAQDGLDRPLACGAVRNHQEASGRTADAIRGVDQACEPGQPGDVGLASSGTREPVPVPTMSWSPSSRSGRTPGAMSRRGHGGKHALTVAKGRAHQIRCSESSTSSPLQLSTSTKTIAGAALSGPAAPAAGTKLEAMPIPPWVRQSDTAARITTPPRTSRRRGWDIVPTDARPACSATLGIERSSTTG